MVTFGIVYLIKLARFIYDDYVYSLFMDFNTSSSPAQRGK